MTPYPEALYKDIKKIDRVIRHTLGIIALTGFLGIGGTKAYDSLLYSGVNIDYNEKGDDEIDLLHFNSTSDGTVHIKTFESNMPGISSQTDFFVDDVHLTKQEVQLYAQQREEEKKFKEAIENILNTTLEKYKDEIESDLDFSPDSEYTSENLAIQKFLNRLYAYSYNKTHIGNKISPENVSIALQTPEDYTFFTPYLSTEHTQSGEEICILKTNSSESHSHFPYGEMLIATPNTQDENRLTEKVLATDSPGKYIRAFNANENPEYANGEYTLLDIAEAIHLGKKWESSETPYIRKDMKNAFINSLANILQEKDLDLTRESFTEDLKKEETDDSR